MTRTRKKRVWTDEVLGALKKFYADNPTTTAQKAADALNAQFGLSITSFGVHEQCKLHKIRREKIGPVYASRAKSVWGRNPGLEAELIRLMKETNKSAAVIANDLSIKAGAEVTPAMVLGKCKRLKIQRGADFKPDEYIKQDQRSSDIALDDAPTEKLPAGVKSPNKTFHLKKTIAPMSKREMEESLRQAVLNTGGKLVEK